VSRQCISSAQRASRRSWTGSPVTVTRQRGLSLVELMIGLVLGLIVVSAVFNMYTGSARSSRFSEGLQTMQENGRYGVSVLQKGLRLAGYSPAKRIAPFDIAAGNETTLVVRMRQTYDCNGESTEDSGGIAVNTYQLNAARQQITCEGNSDKSRAMSIIEGVDGFRVLYGIDIDNDEVPERYVSYDESIDPFQVSALRFAILVNSGQPIRTRERTETHVLLDAPEADTTMTDRLARDVFSSTVKLRNRR